MLIAELAFAALAKPGSTVAYIAPLKSQSKMILWRRAVDFLRLVTVKLLESEQRIELVGGSTFMLAGSGDAGDHLRGMSFSSVALDEYGLMDPAVWYAVVRPALADQRGEAILAGTPSGRDSLYHLIQAHSSDPDFSSFVFPASESGVLPQEELDALRRSMPHHVYQREMECVFDVPVEGAVWGAEMARAKEERRILPSLPVEPDLSIQCALDLGISDSTACWMWQGLSTGEVRLLAFRSVSGVGLRDVALALREQGVTSLIVPHDIRVRELVSGRSRLETLQDLGFDVRIAPSCSIEEGLSAAGHLLDRCFFDERHCAEGIEMLMGYRRNAETGRPLHGPESHAADSFRYLALAFEPSIPVRRPPSGAVVPVRAPSRSIIAGTRR
jgi:hypothetical protein